MNDITCLLVTYITHSLNYVLASNTVSQMEDHCLSLKFRCKPVNNNKITVDIYIRITPKL